MIASTRWILGCALTLSAFGYTAAPRPVMAQAPAAAPHQSGTVKSTTGASFVLTTAAGQDVTVTVPEAAKVLVVAPGARDLKSATPGTAADVAAGDKVIVSGSAGDSAAALTAVRVILMKQSAIAETRAAEQAAWAQGGGGIVKAVNGSTLVMSSGQRTVTVTTTPATIVRRYSGDSVRFEDARLSSLSAIAPGDQMRVRGTRSEDGQSIAAEEIVAGTFRHFSGLLTGVDASAGTITLKDLATKKVVTVAVTPNSDIHRLPPETAQMIAARLKGRGGAGAAPPAGARGAMEPRPGTGEGAGGDAAARTSRAGSDLSSMISRLPTETLAGLKPGDAVMIVATSPAAGAEKTSAVTVLVGVDPILQASPSGETMTLSPWSLGGGDSSGGDAGGAPGGGGR